MHFELFVVHAESSEVEVYDSIKLSFSRQLNLETLVDPQDLVFCDRNKCLCISNCTVGYRSKRILKVNPNGTLGLLRNWPTEVCGRLSITYDSNVILADSIRNKLGLHE